MDGIAPPRYSIAEVAALFGVSVQTIYRWEREGRIPRSTTIGGRKWHLAETLKDWANAGYPWTSAPADAG